MMIIFGLGLYLFQQTHQHVTCLSLHWVVSHYLPTDATFFFFFLFFKSTSCSIEFHSTKCYQPLKAVCFKLIFGVTLDYIYTYLLWQKWNAFLWYISRLSHIIAHTCICICIYLYSLYTFWLLIFSRVSQTHFLSPGARFFAYLKCAIQQADRRFPLGPLQGGALPCIVHPSEYHYSSWNLFHSVTFGIPILSF